MSARRLELTVGGDRAGATVDALLRRDLGLSGTVIRRVKWLSDGILVDGARVNTRFVPAPGQLLSVRLSDPQRRSGVVPAPGPLDIVYEDGDVVVLNKDPGVSVHPGPGHFDDTLGNFLLHYYDTQGIEADFHPVHRLDRGTSGLMAVAKHPHAQEGLKRQLHTDGFCREYLAVCRGTPQPREGIVDAPLGPAEGSLVKRRVRSDGQSARTHYQVLRTAGAWSLLRLKLDTGRTHQIRVHMAHLGCPLAGDFLYGVEDKDLIPRPALHSFRLSFVHPVTGRRLEFQRPMPGDMVRLLKL